MFRFAITRLPLRGLRHSPVSSIHKFALVLQEPEKTNNNQSNKAEASATKADSKLVDNATVTTKIAQGVAWLSGFYSRSAVIQRSAKNVYSKCIEQGNGGEFHRICKLPDTFQSWFLVAQLHIWMCLVRFKADGSDGAVMYKQIVTLFWHDVEFRMKLSGIDDSSVIHESTKELVSIFYGLLFAYDEGLAKDDAVLAAAVWRNLFHSEKATASLEDVALITAYIRREIASLDAQESERLLTEGSLVFGPPPQQPQ